MRIDMIYADGLNLIENECGLLFLKEKSKESHDKFKVQCDYKISEKCRFEYEVEYRYFIKYINNCNGKLPCIFCSRAVKFTGRNNPNTKYKSLNDNYFSNIDSVEKSYLLGWIASDGHCSKNEISTKISIGLKDAEMLVTLKNLICEELPISYTKKLNKTGTISEMIEFTVNSKTIQKDICKYLDINPGKKSEVVKFPLLNSDELSWAFLRGYFDGDGTINKEDGKRKALQCSISSNSRSMLESIGKFCDNFNIKYSYSINNIYFSTRQALKFLDHIYNNADNLLLPRKYDRYLNWKNGYGSSSFKKKVLRGEDSLMSKLTWEQVKEIRNNFENGKISIKKIGKNYSVSESTIARIIKNETWFDSEYIPKNTNNFLTTEKVKEIRNMIDDGLSDYKIAKVYNVHATTIFAIRKGKTWKNEKD